MSVSLALLITANSKLIFASLLHSVLIILLAGSVRIEPLRQTETSSGHPNALFRATPILPTHRENGSLATLHINTRRLSSLIYLRACVSQLVIT